MEWVETTGRTLEDAKEAALDQLGVDEDDAEFEVLGEPRAGLFGRMRGEARVRARVKPARPRPKLDRRDRRRRRDERRGGGGRAGDQKAGASTAVAGTAADTDIDGGSDEDQSDASERMAPVATGERSGGAGGSNNGTRSRSRNRRRRSTGGRSGSGEAGGAAASVASGTAAGSGHRQGRQGGVSEDDRAAGLDEGSGMSGEVVTLEEQVDITRSFLEGLLESFEIEAEIKAVEVDDDTVEVQVHGDEKRLGLLIGPKGHTLQAIQELARTNLQRRAPGDHAGRVRIDIARYRQLRREALERFTRQVAQDVIASGVRRVLEPMMPADRKVVHDVANELEGVQTASQGEEPYRRVVILPIPGATTSPEPDSAPAEDADPPSPDTSDSAAEADAGSANSSEA